jgi:8-oxo-dGTP pyrophosphatase MutT (NUDIX family)
VTAPRKRLDHLGRWLSSRSPREEYDPAYAEAAVAILLVPDPESILLIRRAERGDDPWSGQMGLPGGRRHATDPDLRHTAVRETHEEVGVDLTRASHLGVLDDLKPVTPVLPPIIVRPHVFLVNARPALRVNPEVAGAWWVNLDSLLTPGVYGRHPVEALGHRMEREGYRLPHGTVWGLTERILTPLLEVIRGGGGR